MNKSRRVSVATAASLFEGKIRTSESLVFYKQRLACISLGDVRPGKLVHPNNNERFEHVVPGA